MERDSEISDLSGRRYRGPAIEIAGGDRSRDVAELDDGFRDAPREEKGEEQNAKYRDEPGDEDVAPRPGNNIPQRRRADRDSDVA
jgi:hypothetical protein